MNCRRSAWRSSASPKASTPPRRPASCRCTSSARSRSSSVSESRRAGLSGPSEARTQEKRLGRPRSRPAMIDVPGDTVRTAAAQAWGRRRRPRQVDRQWPISTRRGQSLPRTRLSFRPGFVGAQHSQNFRGQTLVFGEQRLFSEPPLGPHCTFTNISIVVVRCLLQLRVAQEVVLNPSGPQTLEMHRAQFSMPG